MPPGSTTLDLLSGVAYQHISDELRNWIHRECFPDDPYIERVTWWAQKEQLPVRLQRLEPGADSAGQSQITIHAGPHLLLSHCSAGGVPARPPRLNPGPMQEPTRLNAIQAELLHRISCDQLLRILRPSIPLELPALIDINGDRRHGHAYRIGQSRMLLNWSEQRIYLNADSCDRTMYPVI